MFIYLILSKKIDKVTNTRRKLFQRISLGTLFACHKNHKSLCALCNLIHTPKSPFYRYTASFIFEKKQKLSGAMNKL